MLIFITIILTSSNYYLKMYPVHLRRNLYISFNSLIPLGHGQINVGGGNGVSGGGGGAGGRIAIECQQRYWYGGAFVDRGGAGGSGYELTRGGAAGTAYVANQQRPLSYRELKYMPGTNETYFQVKDMDKNLNYI